MIALRNGIILNQSQESIVNAAVDWYFNKSEQLFQFSGPAGTGKSVVLAAIIQQLQLDVLIEVAPMAYIGAAAIIMRLNGLITAKTIHSWLYEPVWVTTKEWDDYLNRPKKKKLIFVRKKFDPKIKLIVIDEAGTVPLSIKKEIDSLGVKVLVCGDLQQLPPVGNTNPAYLYNGKVHYLTEIMRQKAGSGILYLAHKAINKQNIEPGFYGNVWVIYDDEINDDMLRRCEVVIAGKNSTRDSLNNYIRENLFGFNSVLPNFGEKLVCRKNNWDIEVNGINLTNGLIGTVVNHPGVDGFDGEVFHIDFRPNVSTMPFRSVEVDYKYFTASTWARKTLKNNPYSKGNKFEYAYALTCHIAQGSQYRHGMYIQEFLSSNYNHNLNYTGLTRFTDTCLYVIPRQKYF